MVQATGGPRHGEGRVQLGHAGVRRRRRQLDDGHRRDRRRGRGRAQHPHQQDVRLRVRLLCRRQPDRRVERSTTPCATAWSPRAATSSTPEEAEQASGHLLGCRGPSDRRTRSPSRRRRWPRRPDSRSPPDRRFFVVEQTEIGAHNPFSSEKLGVVLSMFRYSGFDDALEKVAAIYEVGGKGHSCGIYSFDDDHIDRAGTRGAGEPDHGAAAAVEGERRRVRQRHADDLEPRLRDVGRQHHVGEHPPQALHEHHLGQPTDRRGPAARGGALRRRSTGRTVSH